MNAQVLRALFRDAILQVLDNRVFRILCALIALPVAMTFLIGCRQEEVVFLFGWKSITYAELLSAFDVPVPGGRELQQIVIQFFVDLVVAALAGWLGMMLAIAATAFFVPRMIEKGSADTLFSKPVSRFTLYLSRYFTGLLFVALLSIVLVGGMYLGLLLVSGYNDPGILWSALTLTYLFGLIHSVSMLFGLLTRSTVAATLLALIFYSGNGCVHTAWEVTEFNRATSPDVVEALGAAPEKEEDPGLGKQFLKTLVWTMNALHYTLPKTGDAPRIAGMLRRAVEQRAPVYVDAMSRFALFDLPAGLETRFALASPAEVEGEELGTAEADEPEPGERVVLYRAAGSNGDELTLSRQLRAVVTADPDERATTSRGRKETLFDAMQTRRLELEADGTFDDFRSWNQDLAGGKAEFWSWERGGRGGELAGFVYQSRSRGYWYVFVEIQHAAVQFDEEGHSTRLARTLETAGYIRPKIPSDPGTWLEQEMTWDAELKFNAWFSIASSAAFAAVMLLLGWWRINKIDF